MASIVMLIKTVSLEVFFVFIEEGSIHAILNASKH